jgi:hypothetical protein
VITANISQAYISNASVSNVTVTGTATVNLALISNASISNVTVTGVANINTANISNATIANTLTVGGLLSANGGIVTNGANIDVGTGNVTAGTIVLNGTTNQITGLSAGTAPDHAVNKGQLDAVYNELSTRIDQFYHRDEQAFQGVAMAFALNAAPLNLDDGESGVSIGLGTFEGEWAGAIRAQTVTESGLGIGANIGFSDDSFGAGVGASIKF